MPLIPDSPYRPPFPLYGGHLQTIWASEARRVRGVAYARQRLELPRAGGHVGFPRWGRTYWSEARALAFTAQWT